MLAREDHDAPGLESCVGRPFRLVNVRLAGADGAAPAQGEVGEVQVETAVCKVTSARITKQFAGVFEHAHRGRAGS